jgi:hypothetical protein
MSTPPTTSAHLAAPARVVLKDEPDALVERLGSGSDAVVQKTYRNRGLRRLQSLCRQSRAQREHDRLSRIAAAGVPCLQPLGWSEHRQFCCVLSSTLVTRWLPDAVPLKNVLPELRAGGRFAARRALARAMGALVAGLHRAGLLWNTPMPRNALVVGAPELARIVVADPPACLVLGGDLRRRRLALIDLYLGAFSPSRRGDWSRAERLRWLLGYTDGDRGAARALWRRLARRRPLQNVVERALATALFTYIVGASRPRP